MQVRIEQISAYFSKDSIGISVLHEELRMNIAGNTILITGGTSGIGRALAEALHAKGNKVIVAGRRQDLLDEVERTNPGIAGICVDVDDPVSIAEMARNIKEKFTDLNVLINNAGIMRTEDFVDASGDAEVAVGVVNTNINSVLRVTTALLPTLKAQPQSTVIATTSGLAFVPMAQTPTYCGTKAFLHSWLDSLRFQLKDSSVEVLELAPPYVQTELLGAWQKTDPNAMPLQDFIAEVLDLLEKGETTRGEILVERVKPLRWAEKNDKYEFLMNALATH